MPNTDGHRSSFPASVDDFGDQLNNNACTTVEAEDWNLIQDALLKLETHTLRVGRTGTTASGWTPATSGSSRPRMLVKTYTVTATGGDTNTKTFTLAALSASERSYFGGQPFGSGTSVHLQIRKKSGSAELSRAFHCGIESPIDTTGASSWTVQASSVRHGAEDDKIGNADYIISLMILQ
jgi:hypothetical protein